MTCGTTFVKRLSSNMNSILPTSGSYIVQNKTISNYAQHGVSFDFDSLRIHSPFLCFITVC